MAIFVVVRVLDTAYAQLNGAQVQFKLGGGAFVTLAPSSVDGAVGHETAVNALPGTTTRCTVRVTKPGLFPVQQDLLLTTTARPAALTFDGAQDINVRNIDRHSRDSGDINFDIYVVPGELRDASSSIPPILAQAPPLFPAPNPSGQRRPAIPAPILDPGRVQNVVDRRDHPQHPDQSGGRAEQAGDREAGRKALFRRADFHPSAAGSVCTRRSRISQAVLDYDERAGASRLSPVLSSIHPGPLHHPVSIQLQLCRLDRTIPAC